MNLTEELKKRVQELQDKFPNKHVKESFETIKQVLSMRSCELLIPGIKSEPYNAVLSKNDKKGFSVMFEGVNEFPQLMHNEGWLESGIKMSDNNGAFAIQRAHVGGGGEFKLTKEENEKYFTGSLKVCLHLERFQAKPAGKAFHRKILPIDSFDITRFLDTEAFNLVDRWHVTVR